MPRSRLSGAKTVVVKVGSSLLASLAGGLDTAFIARLADQIVRLRQEGRKVILVSSGAVAAGTAEMGLAARPSDLPLIQAAAAVGQSALMEVYRRVFGLYDVTVGQMLLTRDGLADRRRFLHARNTLLVLLENDVLPVINENDVVAVEGLRLKMGDNDALSVAVALLADADALAILSDVPGLYDRPPAEDGAARIPLVDRITPEIFGMAGGSVSGVGTGGMTSKLNAARAARLAAIPLAVVDGHEEGVLGRLFVGQDIGTLFVAGDRRSSSWRQWIAFGRGPDGSVTVDDGARKALVSGGKSLLPIGVRVVKGDFQIGDTVAILDLQGREFARGLVNYSAEQARRVAGKHSEELEDIIGGQCDDTLIHRDNLALLD